MGNSQSEASKITRVTHVTRNSLTKLPNFPIASKEKQIKSYQHPISLHKLLINRGYRKVISRRRNITILNYFKWHPQHFHYPEVGPYITQQGPVPDGSAPASTVKSLEADVSLDPDFVVSGVSKEIVVVTTILQLEVEVLVKTEVRSC